ncbi:MAG: hypothetical protein WD558_09775, partial [Pseudomonadales bacterium]
TNKLSGDMQALSANDIAEDYYQDGRVAFFARGTVKGEYLLTMAYDSDKRDEDLFGTINPGRYYTLYGDASSRSDDAPSSEKLYVRVERDSFSALAGDFSSQLSATELAKYNRSLTGLYSEYYSDRLNYVMFASRTTQAFVRDDLRGEGTSGIYNLSRDRILENSENISIEVRDRLKNERIVSRRQLSRGLDYTIDYGNGEVIFKSPVFSQDEDFNPQFIVAEYEVDVEGDEQTNFGGRFAAALAQGKAELGATIVEERTEGREAQLRGIDATWRFDDGSKLRAEYARSNARDAAADVSGDAYLIEYERVGERLDVDIYIRDYDADFGIGQQSAVETGIRRIGTDLTWRIDESTRITGQVYRQTNVETGRARDVLETRATLEVGETDLQVGVRAAVDSSGEKVEDSTSQQLLVGASRGFGRLRLRSDLELDLGSQAANKDFPNRLLLGGEYALTDDIRLFGQQELSFGDIENTQQSRFGVRSELWRGAQASTTVTREVDDAQRLAANYGFRQAIELDDRWSFDFGLDRAQTLKRTSTPDQEINPAGVPVYEDESDDFTAGYLGAGYDEDLWQVVSRIEYRTAVAEDRYNLATGIKRSLADGVVLAAIVDLRRTRGASDTVENRVGLGYVYRPPDSRLSILDKLELSTRSEKGEFDTQARKIVNNLNANYAMSSRTQLALQYGVKYVVDTIDGDEYEGFTDLVGFELRRLLSDRFDIGIHGSVLHSWNADVMDYAYGISFGVTPTTNVWTSIGYNFDGYKDSDFDEADYTAKGVYLKFRFKFDQNSASQVFKGDNIFKE